MAEPSTLRLKNWRPSSSGSEAAFLDNEFTSDAFHAGARSAHQ